MTILGGGARRRLAVLRRAARMRLGPLRPLPGRRTLFPLDGTARHGGWTYHDERWGRVIHRDEHRRLLREGRALVVRDDVQEPPSAIACGSDGAVSADVAPTGSQSWVWLNLDPAEHQWRNFRWDLTVRRDTAFRELQLAFRYRDFYNRYRFRHEDDQLHFDIVVNGAFRNSIDRVPFRMELGRDYSYCIEARGNRFVLAVDGVTLLDEVDPDRLFPRGPIAVVFWEPNLRTPIRASVRSMRVVET